MMRLMRLRLGADDAFDAFDAGDALG